MTMTTTTTTTVRTCTYRSAGLDHHLDLCDDCIDKMQATYGTAYLHTISDPIGDTSDTACLACMDIVDPIGGE